MKEEPEKRKVVYQCHTCDAQKDDKKSMKEHVEKKHSPQVKLGSFKCKQCEYVAVKEGSLEQHMKMKHDNKNEKGPKTLCVNSVTMNLFLRTI